METLNKLHDPFQCIYCLQHKVYFNHPLGNAICNNCDMIQTELFTD